MSGFCGSRRAALAKSVVLAVVCKELNLLVQNRRRESRQRDQSYLSGSLLITVVTV